MANDSPLICRLFKSLSSAKVAVIQKERKQDRQRNNYIHDATIFIIYSEDAARTVNILDQLVQLVVVSRGTSFAYLFELLKNYDGFEHDLLPVEVREQHARYIFL